MRRTLLAVVLVAAAGVAGALTYAAWASEQEFERLMAVGDRADAADRRFEAIEAYSGAVALRPDSMVAHLKRGSVYLEQNELDAALRDLRRATELDSAAARPIELAGDVSMRMGRPERAAERYEAYVALDDQNPRVLYKLALARYRSGHLAAVTEPLELAMALEPGLGEAHYLLGLAQRDAHELAAAKASLETAVKMSPGGQTAAREALAEVHLLEGDLGRWIGQLEALAAMEPARPDRWMAVGLAQARAGRTDAAVTTLSRAVERFPESPQAYAALGHVWLETAEARNDRVALKKAVEALTQAANRPGASTETLTELARARMQSGDPAAAERALRQAVSRLPVPPDAYLHLATLTARDGRIQDARDALVSYATLVGDSQPLGTVASRIADFSMRLGEPALAVRWFERAVDESGPSAPLLVRLADAAWKAGDLRRAHQVVADGLAVEPQHRALRQLQQRLPPP